VKSRVSITDRVILGVWAFLQGRVTEKKLTKSRNVENMTHAVSGVTIKSLFNLFKEGGSILIQTKDGQRSQKASLSQILTACLVVSAQSIMSQRSVQTMVSEGKELYSIKGLIHTFDRALFYDMSPSEFVDHCARRWMRMLTDGVQYLAGDFSTTLQIYKNILSIYGKDPNASEYDIDFQRVSSKFKEISFQLRLNMHILDISQIKISSTSGGRSDNILLTNSQNKGVLDRIQKVKTIISGAFMASEKAKSELEKVEEETKSSSQSNQNRGSKKEEEFEEKEQMRPNTESGNTSQPNGNTPLNTDDL
jgi:predicted lipoprotein with Yx(FWY)xxD motif